jgi:peptidyl-prolyl cis-trans isomerase A (cyclophilin A)
MKILLFATTLLLAGMAASGACAAGSGAATRVALETEKGTIVIEVDGVHAPRTAANFLRYVDGGYYDGGLFVRTVRPDNTRRHDIEIQVIQGGENPAHKGPMFPAVALERTSSTGLRHTDGTISMSRDGPDTAQAGFFFCVGDQPSLDFGGKRNPDGQGFAAFGRVVSGMDVVRAIQACHGGPGGEFGTETLTPAIRILKARRL